MSGHNTLQSSNNTFKHRADRILCAFGSLHIERKTSLMMFDIFARREGEGKKVKQRRREEGKKKRGKEGMKKGKKRERRRQTMWGKRIRKVEWESLQDNLGKIRDEALQNNVWNLYSGFVSSTSRISQYQTLCLKGWLNPVLVYKLMTAVFLRDICTILYHFRKNTWDTCLSSRIWQTRLVNLSITTQDHKVSLMTN